MLCVCAYARPICYQLLANVCSAPHILYCGTLDPLVCAELHWYSQSYFVGLPVLCIRFMHLI